MAFFDLDWLGKRRVNGYARILFVVLALATYKPFHDAIGKIGSDFYAFWAAGRLAVDGAAARAYDVTAIAAVQASAGWDKTMAFVNPPAMLPIVAPLGWLDYPVAWIAWVVATFAFWFSLSRPLAPRLSWPIAAYPGAAIAAWHAQTGLLTGGFLSGATFFLGTRPFLAGLCFGALVIKPHLALLVPIALLADRQWRAIGGAAASAIGLLLFAWTLYGTQAMLAYRLSFDVSRILMAHANSDFLLRMSTVYAGVRLFLGDQVAIAVQALISLVMVALTWRVWSRPGPIEGKLAFLMTATTLATPYLFSYDLPFLIVPLLWLAKLAMQRGWRRGEKPALAFLYVAPLLSRAMALPVGFNFMPLALVFQLWLVHSALADRPTGPESALAPAR